jgi:hypothetical protein
MRLLLLLLAWPFRVAWSLFDWWRDLDFDDKVLMAGALLIVLVLLI